MINSGVLVRRVLYPVSLPAQALAAARKTGVILMSDDMKDELVDVLSRPKFARYARREEIEIFLQSYLGDVEHVPVTFVIRACIDPNDDKVLALAISGSADTIISSDVDLLAMHPFRNVEILTPRQFLDRT